MRWVNTELHAGKAIQAYQLGSWEITKLREKHRERLLWAIRQGETDATEAATRSFTLPTGFCKVFLSSYGINDLLAII